MISMQEPCLYVIPFSEIRTSNLGTFHKLTFRRFVCTPGVTEKTNLRRK